MKILTTGDWHIGNLFHGNDRLPEHRHFLDWLLAEIVAEQPDALLVAGDVFDNGNPSAAAQSAYYAFLADATDACPTMQIIITAGNHDSATRLEAPRALLTRHRVEVRGSVQRTWQQGDDGGCWQVNYDDLMIPLTGRDGEQAVVLAVPYLRSDVVQSASYSEGVNRFLCELTDRARQRFPAARLVMMAHMYAQGADIAASDASEKIVIGGQEEVSLSGWMNHPDYLTCGHIHKRQRLWGTDWARYTGSVLPMSFAEVDYEHGVDRLTITGSEALTVDFLRYQPEHPLRVLPEGDEELSPKKLLRLIEAELPDRVDGKLDEHFIYLVLRVKLERANSDAIRELEEAAAGKNVVLCKIQKILPGLDLTTIVGNESIRSVEDILSRDPLDTLRETFMVKHNAPMTDHQEQMLRTLLTEHN